MKVLAIAERVRGALEEGVFELAAAGRALAGGDPVAVAVLGDGIADDAAALAAAFDVVHVHDGPAHALPDGGRDGAVLAALIRREGYDIVLALHGNLALDLLPPLAARLDRPLVTDVLAVEAAGDGLHLRRALHGGKLHGRYALDPAGGFLLTLRGGAFEARRDGGAGVRKDEAGGEAPVVGRETLRTLEPEPGAVDIGAAEILVGVGRGIEEEENLELVQALAEALGGEVACSRPVVDKGWLPKTRQVGTSGVAVKPKVYVAVGISGSFQHVGGIKGSPFVVAVNKDPKAPIFGFADIGVVGDLFEIVPVLTERVRAARG